MSKRCSSCHQPLARLAGGPRTFRTSSGPSCPTVMPPIGPSRRTSSPGSVKMQETERHRTIPKRSPRMLLRRVMAGLHPNGWAFPSLSLPLYIRDVPPGNTPSADPHPPTDQERGRNLRKRRSGRSSSPERPQPPPPPPPPPAGLPDGEAVELTVRMAEARLPPPSCAVRVSTFGPAASGILHVQLVVPVAVPLPPAELVQVTELTRTLSEALPPTVK